MGQDKNNPWTKENPTNADYFQMIVEQNLRDGMPQDAAEFNAVQEMQHYMKEGINPMGPINGREAGFNASQGKALEREMQQQEQLQKAKDYEAAMTNSKGQSFGDWQVEQELARQAAVKARQNYNPYAETRADGMSFGDWQVQQTLAKQAAQEAKDKEFGRMLGQAIIDPVTWAEMENLKPRNTRMANDLEGFVPPTIKLQEK